MYNRGGMCGEIVAAHDLDHRDFGSARSIHIRKAMAIFRSMQCRTTATMKTASIPTTTIPISF
jgi:hypothetical protein